MSSKLRAVKPASVEAGRVKMLIFGKSGVGKTFTALDFPNCYYIDTEGGAKYAQYTEKLTKSGGAYFGKKEGANSFEEVTEEVKALATEKHTYKTLVIDSISKLWVGKIAETSDEMMKRKVDMNKTYGAENKPAATLSKILMDWIYKLDMNVILISYQKPDYGDDGGREKKGDTFNAWASTDYELDFVGQITKQAGSRYVNIIKSRLKGFISGQSVDWSYKTFADALGKEGLEADSKSLQLATPEQIEELKTLLGKWTPPENWVANTLTAAKAEKFSEIDKDKMSTILEYINNKLTTEGE